MIGGIQGVFEGSFAIYPGVFMIWSFGIGFVLYDGVPVWGVRVSSCI
jgi:hypothetical protein